MPGEEIEGSVLAVSCKICKHILKDIKAVCYRAESRSADFKVGKSFLKMIESYFEEFKKLIHCTAPGRTIALLIACVRLIPYLPILNIILEAVCPALVVVHNYMFANLRPLFKIRRRQSAVLLHPMLNLVAQAVKDLGPCLLNGFQVFIGQDKIVGCGVIYIRVRIRKNRPNVHSVLPTV